MTNKTDKTNSKKGISLSCFFLSSIFWLFWTSFMKKSFFRKFFFKWLSESLHAIRETYITHWWRKLVPDIQASSTDLCISTVRTPYNELFIWRIYFKQFCPSYFKAPPFSLMLILFRVSIWKHFYRCVFIIP